MQLNQADISLSSSNLPLLLAENLQCGRGNLPVLSGISFEIKKGEILALLGENGSGKSTLIQTLMGLLPKHSGEISIQRDQMIAGLGQKKRMFLIEILTRQEIALQVAYVPQSEVHLFPYSVQDLVMMARLTRSQGLFESSQDYEVVEEALAKTEIVHLREKSLLELSGGEKQRVLIARALAQEAPCLLLDEPFSNLDIAHELKICNLLKQLKKDGYGILIAMHDLNRARELADQGLLLYKGHSLDYGPIEQVLSPKNLQQAYGVTFEKKKYNFQLPI